MGGRTFRSRWVIRWGMVFGGLCTAVALLLFVAAYQKSQERDVAAEEAQARNAKICEEQVANGTGGSDSPCELRFGGSANQSAKGFLSAGVLLAVGLTQLIGAGRIGVTLTGTGIILRNPLRTYRLRWSEIKSFRTEIGYRGPMSYAFGRVDLINGDTHRIEAICAMPWESKDTFLDKRVIDALNAELEAHRDDDANDLTLEPGSFDMTAPSPRPPPTPAPEVAEDGRVAGARQVEADHATAERLAGQRAAAERAAAERLAGQRAAAERAAAVLAASAVTASADDDDDDDDDAADLFDIGDPFDGVNDESVDVTDPSTIV